MAFLASATPTFSSSFTPSLFSAKTAQILDNSKRNERFKVALSDRIGTGEHVPFPDPTKCSPCYITDNVLVPYNCCPPVPQSEIKPYKFPHAKVHRVRQAAHLVDDRYIEKYMKAIKAMKDLNNDDPINFYQQANVHCAYANYGYHNGDLPLQVHASWLFFPFHRWYLYFFEKIAGTLIDDPTFALPFWNWDAPCGMTIPYMFVPEKSPLDSSKPNPLYDEYRNPDHLPPAVVDFNQSSNAEYNAPDIQKVCNNLAVMYRQMVTNGFNASSFMGKPYYFDSRPKPGMGSLEMSPHGLVHVWTGTDPSDQGKRHGMKYREDMGTSYSAAKDPIFYSHHANVDRLWTIWLTLGGRRRNFRQKAWLDSKFFFYDENRNPVYVTVGDCLDNKEKLGYTYQPQELLWRCAKPIPKKPKSREAKDFRAAPLVTDVFPAKLKEVIKVSVQRSKKKRTKEEKEAGEEILVIEGIELPSDEFVRFDVFINDDDEKGLVLSKAEYAGTFANVPHGPMSTDMTIGLNEILEDLESEHDEYILVTLIPKSGCDNVIVDSIKIDFEE